MAGVGAGHFLLNKKASTFAEANSKHPLKCGES